MTALAHEASQAQPTGPGARSRRPLDPRRVAAFVAIALTAAAALSVILPGVRPTTPLMRNRTPPVPAVRASEVGAIRQLGRVDGRDNGQSTRYGDRSIWIFADTVLRSPWGFLSNTGAATTDLDAADGITLTAADPFGSAGSAPAELLPLTAAERAFQTAHASVTPCAARPDPYCGARFGFWPGPVIADPARHRVLVFYNKLCRGSDKPKPCSGWLGKSLGTGVAAIDMTTHRITRLTASPGPALRSIEGADPTMFFPALTGYAAAALVVGDDAYVYGNCGGRCHLARVPLNRIADRSRWRFYAGRDQAGAPQWSSDPIRSMPTIAAGAAGNTVLWSPGLRAWLNIFMRYGGKTIDAQVGGSPYGPWSAVFRLRATPTDAETPNYAAFGHAEYAERDGLVQYVSYYQGTTGDQRLVKVTFRP